jgi:hypothetical protein
VFLQSVMRTCKITPKDSPVFLWRSVFSSKEESMGKPSIHRQMVSRNRQEGKSDDVEIGKSGMDCVVVMIGALVVGLLTSLVPSEA